MTYVYLLIIASNLVERFLVSSSVPNYCYVFACTQISFPYIADRLVPITVTIDIVLASSLDLTISTTYQLYARKSKVMVNITLINTPINEE